MFNSLKLKLHIIYTIIKKIIHYGGDCNGCINFKCIIQGVHFKYEQLYTKFIKLINTAKEKINSDIERNKSITL
jgi:hypothetical protein